MSNIGLYIVGTVLVISLLLVLVAAFSSKARKWKFRSPIQQVMPKKKRKAAPKKKKLPIVQITFNKR